MDDLVPEFGIPKTTLYNGSRGMKSCQRAHENYSLGSEMTLRVSFQAGSVEGNGGRVIRLVGSGRGPASTNRLRPYIDARILGRYQIS